MDVSRIVLPPQLRLFFSLLDSRHYNRLNEDERSRCILVCGGHDTSEFPRSGTRLLPRLRSHTHLETKCRVLVLWVFATTLLKRTEDGTFQEVLPDMVFHMGDAIRLSLTANQHSYLYLVQQGSSGAWSPLHHLIRDPKMFLRALTV